MTKTVSGLTQFLSANSASALVEVVEAKGSTPRERGAWMLVSPESIFGTIGGGQLEFMAIDRARAMLQTADARRPPPSPSSTPPPRGGRKSRLDIALGPEIGQCCGGRVELSLSPVDDALRADLLARAAQSDAQLPHVLVFGGGHVGRALAAALALLPVNATVVETRSDALDDVAQGITARLTPVPEEMVQHAPPGSAFVVLTHDHALDFLIVAAALDRGDASYVGMIGSKTKKATFRNWYLKEAGGSETSYSRLVTPIGGSAIHDKRPAVIATLAAAEIVTALA